MGYVIAGIIVVLIASGFVWFLIMNAMRKGAGSDTSDPSARQSERGGPPGMGQDPTPFGDTSEHAGEQSATGETAADPEAPGRGPGGPEERQRRDSGAPASERLADRPS
jgi:hypothetical protein